MPYIIRDQNGEIIKVTTQDIYGAELAPYDHPDFEAFLLNNGHNPKELHNSLDALRKTDAAMARAIEDVINALLKKNLLRMTDLPKPVQERISERIKHRLNIENMLKSATDTYANKKFLER